MTDPTTGSAPEPQPPTAHIPTAPIPTSAYRPGHEAQVPEPVRTPAPAGVGLADESPGGTGRTGNRRTALLVGGVAAALVLGGGGVFAAQQLSGGGAQPAEVLPGDAFAYVRLDVDPSAGQKVAAVRFLDKLPRVKDTLGADDPRKKLWDAAAKDASNDCVAAFDYDSDIAPWLGDRIGLAVRPGGTAKVPNVAVAVQVTDEGRAQDVLTRLLACDRSTAEIRMKDGYAILTPTGKGDATVAAIDRGTLAASATFTGDMAALGEQGVVSAWVDGGAAVKEMSAMGAGTGNGSSLSNATPGRFAAALRFDPGYIELAAIGRDGKALKAGSGDGSQLANLPDDTAAAVHVSGADQMIDAAWPELAKQLDTMGSGGGQGDIVGMIEDQLGVTLPDDLKVLLGRSMTISVPDQRLGGDVPLVGAKIVSSDAARADAIVGHLEDATGSSGFLTRKVVGDTLYLGTTPGYVSTLQAGGRLGDSDTFKAAVGDPSKSNVAMFVDLDRLEKQYLPTVPDDSRAGVEALRAVGVNASVTGDGQSTFSMRIVGN